MSHLCQNRSRVIFCELAKAHDQNYLPVRGHVQRDIARRFKAVCSMRGIDFGAGMEEALVPWIEREEKELLPPKEDLSRVAEPQTFTELVRNSYFALMNAGKINHSRLKELAFGQKPSVAELGIVAKVLDIPEEVVTDLRDRTFKKGAS